MNERPKILIVDDKPDNLMAIEKALQDTGAEIVKAGSGNEALAACLNHEFVLAIIDVHMPEMDGYELAEHMRGDERTQGVPIIFITGSQVGVNTQFRRYETGAVGFIQRPVSPEILRAKARVFIELARREAQLRASEELFRSTFEQAAVGIAHVAPDGSWLRVNRRLCETVGYSEEELLALTFQDITYPDDLAADVEHLRQVLAGETTGYSMEKRYVRKDGSLVWIYLTVALVRDASGAPDYFISVVEDTSTRKRAEEDRDRLFNASIDMLCVAGFDGSLKRINPAWTKTLGWTEEEMTARPWLDFVHPNDRQATIEIGGRLLSGEKVVEFENRYRCKDGSYRWLSWSSTPIPDREELVSVTRDVTEQRKVQEELRASEAKYRSLASNSDGMVYRGSTDWSVEFALGAEALCGYASEGFVSGAMTWADVIHPEDRQRVFEESRQLPRCRKPTIQTYRIIDKEGNTRWVDDHKVSRFAEDGTFLGVDGVVFDMTERHSAQESLKKEEARYRLVVKATGIAVWDWDLQSDVTIWNENLPVLFGYEAGIVEDSKQWWQERIHPDDAEAVARALSEAIEKRREAWSAEYRFLCADGRYATVVDWGSVVEDENGQPVSMTGAMMDVTEQRAVAAAVRQSEKRLSTILQTANEGFIQIDGDARTVDVNPEMCRILNRPREHILGRPVFDFADKKNQAILSSEIQRRKGGAQGAYEISLEQPDGASIPCFFNSSPMVDEDGKICGSFAMVSDITRLKRLQQILDKRAKRAQGLQEAGEKVVGCATVEDLAELAAEAPVKYLGLKYSWVSASDPDGSLQLIAASCPEVGDCVRDSDCMRRVLNSPESLVTPDTLNDPPFGEPCVELAKQHGFACCATYPIFVGDKCVAALAVRDDQPGEDGPLMQAGPLLEVFCRQVGQVWERCLREEQLKTAQHAAEAASKAKSDFLANMSHELRTPLNAIIGFSQVLQEGYFGELQPRYKEYVQDIIGSGRHLLALINDILDLSKVEAGKLELELSQVRIADLIENSMSLIREKAHKHGIQTGFETDAEVTDLEIEADERKVKQIMFNLLSNAAKFTPDGGRITVRANRDNNHLLISVTDTGIGIATEDQERVFEDFYQTKQSTRDKTPGTGLGLALVKRLVALHGGCVWVESKGEGRGSCFSFTVPLRQPAPVEGIGTQHHEAAELPISDEHSLEEVLSGEISLAREHNQRFALCRLQPPASDAEVNWSRVREAISDGMRGPDRLLQHIQGRDCLILMHTGRAGAQRACDRLSAAVRETLKISVAWTIVGFPEDGGSPSVLVEKLENEEDTNE